LAGATVVASFTRQEQLEQANKILKDILLKAIEDGNSTETPLKDTAQSEEADRYIQGKKEFLAGTVAAAKKFSSLSEILTSLQDTINKPYDTATKEQD
jgi:hypothetical protein